MEIRVKANKTKRTFTIIKYDKGILYTKYRTIQFSKAEFEELESNTSEDWMNFLRTENAYFTI